MSLVESPSVEAIAAVQAELVGTFVRTFERHLPLIEKLRKKIDDIRTQLGDSEAARTACQQEAARLKSQLHVSEERHTEGESLLRQEASHLAEQLEEAEAARRACQQQISSLKAQLEESEAARDAYKKEVDTFKASLAAQPHFSPDEVKETASVRYGTVVAGGEVIPESNNESMLSPYWLPVYQDCGAEHSPAIQHRDSVLNRDVLLEISPVVPTGLGNLMSVPGDKGHMGRDEMTTDLNDDRAGVIHSSTPLNSGIQQVSTEIGLSMLDLDDEIRESSQHVTATASPRRYVKRPKVKADEPSELLEPATVSSPLSVASAGSSKLYRLNEGVVSGEAHQATKQRIVQHARKYASMRRPERRFIWDFIKSIDDENHRALVQMALLECYPNLVTDGVEKKWQGSWRLVTLSAEIAWPDVKKVLDILF